MISKSRFNCLLNLWRIRPKLMSDVLQIIYMLHVWHPTRLTAPTGMSIAPCCHRSSAAHTCQDIEPKSAESMIATYVPPFIISAAFSATAYTEDKMLPRGISGKTLASTTRMFSVPYTTSFGSTTPPFSRGCMAAVPQPWYALVAVSRT